jgi:gamma-glutamylcyclotransferase (GGCT)/AIG2-like uncharacterized protein YtfP
MFVYGTLKSGFGNNRVMRDNGGRAEFMGAYRTADDFIMCGMGFPRVSRVPDNLQLSLVQSRKIGCVMGEVWSVNDASLAAMDRLEGHPNFYCREQVRVVPERSQATDLKPVTAWMYLIPFRNMDMRSLMTTRMDRTHLWTR